MPLDPPDRRRRSCPGSRCCRTSARAVLLAGAVLLAVCLPAAPVARGEEPAADRSNNQVTTYNDVTYSTAGETELKLDLAVPAGDGGPHPMVVFIHGGGWAGGSRLAFRRQIQEAARRGYVGATVSYRLMKYDRQNKETTTAEQPFPAQVHDVKAAIRWLRANAKKYHADPERIGVTGFSAGGHLVLMLGLTDKDSGLEGNGGHPEVSSRVQAVVNVFGPTEMKTAWQQSSVAWIYRLFLGGTPEEAAEHYRLASPVTWVSADDPPVLTIHGDLDRLVPVSNARLLDQTMKAAGASHELLILKGQGHGFRGEAARTMVDATWKFFEKQLKTPAAAATGSSP